MRRSASPQGAVSAPVAGRFGTSIVRVVKIEPALDQELCRGRSRDQARHRARPRQGRGEQGPGQDRGGIRRRRCGSTRSPRGCNIPLRTIDAVDRSGRVPGRQAGRRPAGRRRRDQQRLCDRDRQRERSAELSRAAAIVWYDVADITPSRDRTLDEVKEQVEARWHEDEIVRRLDAKTTEILDKLKSGTSARRHRRRRPDQASKPNPD